jgi:signal transduction histidine kinase
MTQQFAHHLRTPISSMQAAVEHLTQSTDSKDLDKIREDSATLASQLTNLQAMMRCLSEFSSIPPPQLQLVDLNELVSRMLQDVDPQLRTAVPPIRPEVLLERDVPKVMADPELLQRMLHGLVLNALDAMPEGGNLTVQTQRTESGAALVSISDNGRGWSQEEMKELFIDGNLTEPEGAGWGIAIVQAVVSDIDGHVSVESAPGKGTKIRIELPKAGAGS